MHGRVAVGRGVQLGVVSLQQHVVDEPCADAPAHGAPECGAHARAHQAEQGCAPTGLLSPTSACTMRRVERMW